MPRGPRQLRQLQVLRPDDAQAGLGLRPLEQPAGDHRRFRLPRSVIPVRPGLYIFADYASGETWVLGRTSSGGYPRSLVATFNGNLSGFGEADLGEIYAVDLGGSLWHVIWHRA